MLPKIPLNIPNVLSLYRLITFPLVLWLALAGHEKWFVILLCINLVTDILDGWIARTFNMVTEIGAKLDSLADNGTFILAFLGIFLFKKPDFEPHLFSFGTFIGLFVLINVFSLLKFHQTPSLHLYSVKIGGYIQGFFFFVLFTYGFITPFYYLMVGWGIMAFSEHLIVQMLIKKMKPNAKGLYWVLKDREPSA